MGIQPLVYFTGEASKGENREWFEKFEFIADSSLWDPEARRRTLIHYCRESAREWLKYLSRDEKSSWKQLRTAFKAEYCVDERSVRRQYNSAKQKETESPLTFFRRLTNLAKLANISLRTDKDLDEHMDIFYDGLRERAIWKEFRWKTFGSVKEVEQLLKRAEEVLRKGEKREKSSAYKPRPPSPKGEKARAKRTAQVYRAELEDESDGDPNRRYDSDESAVSCPSDYEEDIYVAQATQTVSSKFSRGDKERRGREGGTRTVPKCQECGRMGHESATCWAKMTCTICQGIGHPAEFCYRRCTFCDQVHEQRGPCPMKRPVQDLIQWVKSGGEKTGTPMPKVPEQLLNC